VSSCFSSEGEFSLLPNFQILFESSIASLDLDLLNFELGLEASGISETTIAASYQFITSP